MSTVDGPLREECEVFAKFAKHLLNSPKEKLEARTSAVLDVVSATPVLADMLALPAMVITLGQCSSDERDAQFESFQNHQVLVRALHAVLAANQFRHDDEALHTHRLVLGDMRYGKDGDGVMFNKDAALDVLTTDGVTRAKMLWLITIRKNLSIKRNQGKGFSDLQEAMVEEVVVQALLAIISDADQALLWHDTVWIMCNLCSSELCPRVVDAGAIPVLQALMTREDLPLRMYSVTAWTVGNIAGDKDEYRRALVEDGVAHMLVGHLEAMEPDGTTSDWADVCWTLSTVVRGPLAIPIDVIVPIVPGLVSTLSRAIALLHGPSRTKHLEEGIGSLLWALSYLCRLDDEQGLALVGQTLVPVMAIPLLAEPGHISSPALRLLGDLAASSSNEYLDVMMPAGLLNSLALALKNHSDSVNPKSKSVRKQIMWALSNVAGGSDDHLNSLFSSGIIRDIIRYSFEEPVKPVLQEVAWVISNAVVNCTDPDTIVYLVIDAGLPDWLVMMAHRIGGFRDLISQILHHLLNSDDSLVRCTIEMIAEEVDSLVS